MSQWRQSSHTANVEEQDHEHHHDCDHDNQVSALESSGGYRNLGTWELSNLMAQNVPARAKHFIKSHHEQVSRLIDKNPFAVLSNEGPEEVCSTTKDIPRV